MELYGNGIKIMELERDDGMPEPRAMNIAVFLDDVTAANGPLLFIPGSHKTGVIDAGHDLETTSYPLWTLDNEKVLELLKRWMCCSYRTSWKYVNVFVFACSRKSTKYFSIWPKYCLPFFVSRR